MNRLVAVVALVVLAGCGGTDTSSTPSLPPGTPSSLPFTAEIIRGAPDVDQYGKTIGYNFHLRLSGPWEGIYMVIQPGVTNSCAPYSSREVYPIFYVTCGAGGCVTTKENAFWCACIKANQASVDAPHGSLTDAAHPVLAISVNFPDGGVVCP